MNPFESTLASALRDEAQEIAMSTNLNDGRATLDRNLDNVDASGRRRRWITGLVAVAVVGAVVAVMVGVSRPTATPVPPATSPSLSAPASSSDDALLGVWRATFTRDEVASVLAAAGLSGKTQRVLDELAEGGDPMTWELWVDPTMYRLYLVRSDGTKVMYDQHTYTRDGGTVTGTTTDGQALVTVSTIAVDGDVLRWEVESADTEAAGTPPEEAMERALYTTAAWQRQSS